jgi:hemerythrin-like domain-containing protein
MGHATPNIIRREHGALSAMLRSISLLLAEHRRRGTLPDFSVLRAMLFYVDEFPEKLHHTKESQLLFPKLRARSAEAAAVLDRLDHEHADGERAIRELEHELLGFEMMGEARRERFEQAMTTYIAFYLAHMQIEETVVLPLAERVLTDRDWAELDSAFTQNRDPLAGHDVDGEYRAVFKKILTALPSPLGLGSALEALSGVGMVRGAATP